MARGSSNTSAGYVTGDPLPPAAANDLLALLASADDDALFDLIGLEPPAAASATNVATALVALRAGPIVVGDGAARQVTIAPVRAVRSSTSNASPRSLLSAASSAETTVALPAAVTAGNWRLELLYAQIAYADPTNPTEGTTITFAFAPTGAGAAVAGAPTVATLPANTTSPPTWNVPIAYVKNVGGAASIGNDDIIEFPTSTVHKHLRRLAEQRSGHAARRAYSSANSDPTKLVTGSTSEWLTKGLEQTVTSTVTPVAAGRRNVERVSLEIMIPAGPAASGGGTAGTSGAATEIVLDDTRDWRGANFAAEFWVGTSAGIHFSEEDPSVASPRQFPQLTSGAGASMHRVCGNSWLAYTPHALFGSGLWAAVLANTADIPGAGSLNGVANAWLAAGDGWGLVVDASTGALKWWAKRAGTSSGPPVWIQLDAWFGNHRP